MPHLPFKKQLAVTASALVLSLGAAACGGSTEATTTSAASGQTATATTTAQAAPAAPAAGRGGGTSVGSVSTVDELVSLVQEAYGEPSLGLHRGHQDVESTLIEVLGIAHDEMHVRMDAGQNLAAIAKDVGVEQAALVDALVETRTPAVDALVEAGTLTQAQADAYEQELETAYTYRVSWDGQAATPTATAV